MLSNLMLQYIRQIVTETWDLLKVEEFLNNFYIHVKEQPCVGGSMVPVEWPYSNKWC